MPVSESPSTQPLPAYRSAVSPIDPERIQKSRDRLDNLTKPRGSLGRLEDWISRYAAISGPDSCTLQKKALYLFAADHGVAEESVSAYPQEVTRQMVLNFMAGGAAINTLARHAQADLVVVDVGVAAELPEHPGLISRKIAPGTGNLARQPAMSREQAEAALQLGFDFAVERSRQGVDILAAGEMGIANTTPATAVLAVLFREKVSNLVGNGTGIDVDTRAHKSRIIEQAIELHQPDASDPVDVLSKVGGFEIGAMAGFYLGAAHSGKPVLLDGMISGAGAALALGLQPGIRDYLFPSHISTEPAQRVLLNQLTLPPLLDLEMRLGEGTGAVLAMNLLEGGVRLYNEMATFGDAGVSGKSNGA